jgi:ribosomal protein L37AE/L43A
MILEFRFVYVSSSFMLEKILLRNLKEQGIKGRIKKKENEIFLYAETEDIERMGRFANILAQEIPHSIFLRETEVKVAEEMKGKEIEEIDAPKRKTPFCPKCAREVIRNDSKNFYNPFLCCEICGYDIQKQTLVLKTSKEIIKADKSLEYKNIFEKAAFEIYKGNVLKVKTFYGEFCIGKLNENNTKNIEFDIICFDLATVEKYTLANGAELLAIAAIEKPFLRLKTNAYFKTSFPFLKEESFRFKLPDDFMLYLLLRELNILGESIFFITAFCKNNSGVLNFKGDVAKYKPIECSIEDEKIVILKGEKSLFPIFAQNIKLSCAGIACGYKALMENGKVFIDKSQNIPLKNSLRIFSLEDESMRKNYCTFKPYYGAMFSAIAENNLFDKMICGIYVSKFYTDKIMLYSKKFSVIDYLSFECEFDRVGEIFEAICNMNESGKKLIEKYKKSFEETFENVVNLKIDRKNFNIYKLWGIISWILGFSKDSDIKKAALIIEKNAFSFMGNRGVRIDYKLKRKNSDVYLDFLWTIRTAISYKLANTDMSVISFGIVESFAEFLAENVEEINRENKIDAVVVNGSLLEVKPFFHKIYENISKNYSFISNNELPVDKLNFAYGGAVFGSILKQESK